MDSSSAGSRGRADSALDHSAAALGVEGVSRQASGASVAFLLIHGFCADADEVASLGEFLENLSISSFAVRLAGHGTTPEALLVTSRQDWYKSVDRGLDRVISWGPKHVFVAGLSLGGALALRLACLRADISGVVLISPAVLVGGTMGKLLPLLKRLIRYRHVDPEHVREQFGYDLPRFKYEREPLSSIHEVLKVASEVRKLLPTIGTPTLILQSGSDRSIDPRSGLFVYSHIASPEKELHIIDGAPHVIPCHPTRARAYPFIPPFVENVASSKR